MDYPQTVYVLLFNFVFQGCETEVWCCMWVVDVTRGFAVSPVLLSGTYMLDSCLY